MNYARSLGVAALWLALSHAPAGAQNFDQGLAAARAGDFAAAVALWRPLASNGDIEAQFNIGAIYDEGLGMPANPGEAAGWYGLAAEQGHVQAQYNLGMMYAAGRGVPRNDLSAAVWLRKAADQNHAKAQYNLAVFYQSGRGLAKDSAQAQYWFRRAGANGVQPPPQTQHEPDTEPAEYPTGSEIAPVAVRPESQPNLAPTPSSNVASVPAGLLRIAASFPEGAKYRLEVVETRERARDGAFVMAQTSAMEVDMVVKPDPGEGALIEWTFGPATVKTAGDPKAGRLASELGKLIEGQKVEYHTDRAGKVTTLGNKAQLTSFYEKSLDRILGGLDAQAADPQLADDIRVKLAPLLAQDYAAARALDLPKLLHFFSGLDLAAGKTYTRASVMSLPPSAEALPSILDYELKWFDRAAGVAWLSWRQTVKPERAATAIRAYIATLVDPSGQSASEELEIGAIKVSDSADYELDLATGFPRQVIYTRKVELFGFSQTEKRRIRVLR